MDKLCIWRCLLLPHLIYFCSGQLTIISSCLNNKHFYDVTNQALFVDSHDNYDFENQYPPSTSRCMEITTNTTDHVIKLEESEFDLENSYGCSWDYLVIFDGAMNTATYDDEVGTYCSTYGPETTYSSGSSYFLYFSSDPTLEDRGFRFKASSIHKDDVPSVFSAAAIVGIILASILVICLIIMLVCCCVKAKTKPRTSVHPQSCNDNRSRVAMISVSSATYCQQRQQIPHYRPHVQPVRPPPYQEHAMPRNTEQARKSQQQRVGHQPPNAPVQDAAYPPPAPAAIYGVAHGGDAPSTSAPMPYPMSPPPPYEEISSGQQ